MNITGRILQRGGDDDPDPAARLTVPIHKRPEDEEHLGQLDGALPDGGVQGREIQPDEREKRPLHPSGEIEQPPAHQPEGRPDRAPQGEKNQPVDQAVGAEKCQGKGDHVKPGTVTPVPLKADVSHAENVVLQENRIVGFGEGRGEGRIIIPGDGAGGASTRPRKRIADPRRPRARRRPFLPIFGGAPLAFSFPASTPGLSPSPLLGNRLRDAPDDSTEGRLHASQGHLRAGQAAVGRLHAGQAAVGGPCADHHVLGARWGF